MPTDKIDTLVPNLESYHVDIYVKIVSIFQCIERSLAAASGTKKCGVVRRSSVAATRLSTSFHPHLSLSPSISVETISSHSNTMEIAGGVFATIQIAEMILKYCGGYLRDVKDSRNTIASLESEIGSVKKVLEDIQLQLNSPGGQKKLQTSQSLQGAIKGCTVELERLKSILEKLQDRRSRFKWPFKKTDVTASITRIGRCKQNIILALQIDQTVLLLDAEKDVSFPALPIAPGAFFDSFNNPHDECLPNTRSDLLRQVTEWADDPAGKCIFRLDGMAGTGKSTISRTLARLFKEKDQLGASFFFKRGQGSQGDASRLFTTIAQQLLVHIHELRPIIQRVLTEDPLIPERSLRDQFQSLVFKPLNELKKFQCTVLIIVIDALDECEPRRDVPLIIRLLALLKDVKPVNVRVFLTSRPEMPIPSSFKHMDDGTYQDLVLHEIPNVSIQHDIALFLEHRLDEIRSEFVLPSNWPGDETMKALLGMVVPLFICAATICRYISDPRWIPEDRLKHLLTYKMSSQVSRLDLTYRPVLDQLLVDLDIKEKETLVQEFREVVGSIVLLSEPLSINSLARLLGIPQEHITCRVNSLHSVLRIPKDEEHPISLLHLSFRDFLVDDQKRDSYEFCVDEKERHRRLAQACLRLLSSPGVLKDNICNLSSPGSPCPEMNQDLLPPEVQYACRYWIQHVKGAGEEVDDDSEVHTFLKRHLLHWLECSALLGELRKVMDHLETLESLISTEQGTRIAQLLHDSKRFVMRNKQMISAAPLQIYYSALTFAPEKSIIRQLFLEHIPECISPPSNVDKTWSTKLHSFHHESDAYALSPDGRLFASVSRSGIELWDIDTGEFDQLVEFRTNFHPETVTFSPDCQLLFVENICHDIQCWEIATSRLKHNPEEGVFRCTISPDSSVAAYGYFDKDVKLWNLQTGRVEHAFNGFQGATVYISPNSQLLAFRTPDSVQVWNLSTGDLVQTLGSGKISAAKVMEIVFSPDSKQIVLSLKCGALHHQIQVWDIATVHLLRSLDRSEINQVPFDPKGNLVAISQAGQCLRSRVQLWDLNTGSSHEIIRHDHSIKTVSFSYDGRLAATVDSDRYILLWTLDTGKVLQSWKTDFFQTATCFTPQAKLVVLGPCNVNVLDPFVEGHETNRQLSAPVKVLKISQDGDMVQSVSSDGEINTWNATSEKQEITWKLRCNSGARGSRDSQLLWPRGMPVVFSSDGSLIASSLTNKLEIWNTATGKLIQHIDHGGHDYSCDDPIQFSPNNQILAVAYSGCVKLWDTTTGELRKTNDGHSEGVSCLSFSSDGSLLASGSHDHTVKIRRTMRDDLQPSPNGEVTTGIIRKVSLSRSGFHLLSYDTENVAVWDVATGQRESSLHLSFGVCRTILSPDCQFIAVSGSDRTIKLFELSTGNLRRQWEEPHTGSYFYTMSFSHDGRMLVSSGLSPEGSNWTVQSWDTVTGDSGNTLTGYRMMVSSTYPQYQSYWSCVDGFLPDGKVGLLSGSSDAISFWDPKTNDLELFSQTGSMEPIALSPDGQFMAGAKDGQVRVWNIATGNAMEGAIPMVKKVKYLAFSHNSHLLAIGEDTGDVSVWKLRSEARPRLWKKQFSFNLEAIGFTEKGQIILLGGLPKIWDPDNGDLRPIFRHHRAPIEMVTFSPDGALIATGSADRAVMIWEVHTGELLSIMDFGAREVKEMNFSDDGSFLVTDKGCFRIPKADSGRFLHRPEPIGIYVEGDWIYRGREWVIWLPEDYRPKTFAKKDGLLVLGTESRGLVFLRLKT